MVRGLAVGEEGWLEEGEEMVEEGGEGKVRFQYVARPFHSQKEECGDWRRIGAKRGVRDVGGR